MNKRDTDRQRMAVNNAKAALDSLLEKAFEEYRQLQRDIPVVIALPKPMGFLCPCCGRTVTLSVVFQVPSNHWGEHWFCSARCAVAYSVGSYSKPRL